MEARDKEITKILKAVQKSQNRLITLYNKYKQKTIAKLMYEQFKELN